MKGNDKSNSHHHVAVVVEAQPVIMEAIPQRPVVQKTIFHHHIFVEEDSRTTLSWIGNILWILLAGGALIAAVYAIVGLLLIMTIVGIPFGFQLLKLAKLALFPFGKHIDSFTTENRFYTTLDIIGNILFLPVGVGLAIMHICMGISCALWCMLPFTFQHLKLAQLAIWPFGSREHYHTINRKCVVEETSSIRYVDDDRYGSMGHTSH